MSGVSADSSGLLDTAGKLKAVAGHVEETRNSLLRKYQQLGTGWNDKKYRELGDILRECNSALQSISKTMLLGEQSVRMLARSLREYEDVNLAGGSGGGPSGPEGTGPRTDAPEKRGGSYREVKKSSNGDTHEVHHMPADSASPLDFNDGPTIKMEKDDHRQTASWGKSREAREYCALQRELIEQGNFRGAIQMDIDDIHDKFEDKYDDAIAEMLEYVEKLVQEGIINAYVDRDPPEGD